jgi:hypothetical protein
MMSTFDTTLALTLLAHPFQLALMVVTLGALARSANQVGTGLVYSFFALFDFLLDESLAFVAIGSTVAIAVGILVLAS